ncbi:homocitrate synthase/isopropylmalate synthase family protein [Kitasatospora viridis]|uniref:LeuA family protein n=1 Tax=Kitasatospora viridis TaxID=281105 RepID=UPI0031D56902
MPHHRQITVFDSTLRDGEQAPGNAMSPEHKVALALALEEVGVDVIEAGFPSSSPEDFKAVQQVAQALTTAKLSTLNRAVPADIEAAAEAGGVDRHQIQIMATGSDFHLAHKRGISRQQGIDEVVAAVRLAGQLGFRDVSLGVEDASRGSDELLRPLVTEAVAAGVTTVVLADTTGRLLPTEFGDLVRRVRAWTPPEVVLSTHCHDDLGLGLANALAGLLAGAGAVQTTIGGIGERAGNTPLEELAAVLHYKGDQLGLSCGVRTDGLFAAFDQLCQAIGMPWPRNKAIVGEYVFSTAAGIHQAGLIKEPATYEYVEAARFGRRRQILIGRHSGRAVLRHLVEQAGRAPDPELIAALYERHVAGGQREVTTIEELAAVVAAEAADWRRGTGER